MSPVPILIVSLFLAACGSSSVKSQKLRKSPEKTHHGLKGSRRQKGLEIWAQWFDGSLLTMDERFEMELDALDEGEDHLFLSEKSDIEIELEGEMDRSINLRVLLSNRSDQPRIIDTDDILCFRDHHRGTIQAVRTTEKISFRSGETKEYRMICKWNIVYEGDVHIYIKRFFANPLDDGETKGKVFNRPLLYTVKPQ